MPFYYAGFNTSPLFTRNGHVIIAIDSFTEISFSGITDFHINWNYFLLWRGNELYISGKCAEGTVQRIQIPGAPESCKLAAAGKDSIVVLSNTNELWRYKVYENSWKKVPNYISGNAGSESEYPTKILQAGGTIALTNLGRVFIVPTLIEMPKRVKFVDIACGFDHTILLADNGDLYSMGMGTRGQLGHDDLEDCDNPKRIEALAGIKVVQISAGGWHSAVVTDQGDLYTWGWNTNGELGILSEDTKVFASPMLVDFQNDAGENVETNVKKVECGNTFTVCSTEGGILWGSGCNKYGQLGQSRESLPNSPTFVKLDTRLNAKHIQSFKCHEWGTMFITV